MTSENAIVIFGDKECPRCKTIAFTVKRAADYKELKTKIFTCDGELMQFCEEKGIYNYPTVWLYLDKHPTEIKAWTTLEIVKEIEQNLLMKEDRKKIIIEKQEMPQ